MGDAPFSWNPDTNISTLRIGYLKTEFDGPTTPPANEQQRTQAEQRRAVYKTALEVLEKAGAKFVPIELPKVPAGSLRFILSAEAATAFDDITRDGRVRTSCRVSRRTIGPTRSARRALFLQWNT